MITSEQVKAARGLLRWNQQDLAAASGISLPAIKRLEQLPGPLAAQSRTVEAIIAAFGNTGVEFIADNGGGPGVRIRKSAKGAEEISRQIGALEDKISSMPAPAGPSPEAGMNIMRKAVAKNDLTKLKNRRARITRRDRSK
jgi:transcriptional regulator with XRE-family HTH domain